ncbi:MAG: hypothetical protein ABL951_13330 [Alphaproteobacteria bacterium]
MFNENTQQDITASVHHGKIIAIISFASIWMWILLSDKYDPNFGFLVNVFYMKAEFLYICTLNPHEFYPYRVDNTPCITFRTTNLILFSLMTGTYGVLIWQRLTPSPVFLLRALIAKKVGHNEAVASDQFPGSTNKAEEEQKLPEISNSEQDNATSKVFIALPSYWLLLFLLLSPILIVLLLF